MMLSTGAVARLIDVPEARIQQVIRRGRVCPAPAVAAGRRLWTADQVRQAATHLNALSPEIEGEIASAFGETTEVGL